MSQFKHKLLTSLPTRKTMQNRISANPNEEDLTRTEIRNHIKYQTDECIRCGNNKAEDTEHIFVCEENTSIWTKTADKLIAIISKETEEEFRTLPFWFPNKYPMWHATNTYERALVDFDKNWGARTVIPKEITGFLEKLIEHAKHIQN